MRSLIYGDLGSAESGRGTKEHFLRGHANKTSGHRWNWTTCRRLIAVNRMAKGVGIAGPQVGLSLRVACLMLGYRTKHPRVVFVRNPQILERSDETIEGYEGCLSIPDVGGLVRRSRWIRVEQMAVDGASITGEAEGPDAVLWQHELDHFDGVLYTDRLLGELLPMDEVRRRREAEQGKASGGLVPDLPLFFA